MENQVNVGDKNTQPVGQNTPNQIPVPPVVSTPGNKNINYWMISTIVLLISLVVLVAWFIFSQKTIKNGADNNDLTIQQPVPTDDPESNTSIAKYIAFMRKGTIYFRDLTTNKEVKVSNVDKVGSPKLSSTGKYVSYFSIVHAAGGFPRGDVFVAATNGFSEKKLGSTNEFASKATWSDNGDYYGLILFNEDGTGSGFTAEALLYDVSLQKEISRVKVDLGQDLSIDQYDVNFSCSSLGTKYVTFCEQFVTRAKTKTTSPDFGYKADVYRNSRYTKQGFKLAKSIKSSNNLVILEYYTGEPKNPESQWGIGGGVFVPGYDEGVTETYTLLIDEVSGDVKLEIPLAIDSNFVF